MPQLQLPIFPAGIAHIADELGFECRDGTVTYFTGQMPCPAIVAELRKNYMPVLTIRLTDEEARILTQRSRRAGMKKATLVRQLIREQPYVTAADVLTDMEKFHGDERLRIRRE